MNFVKPRTFILGLVLASVPVFAQGNPPASQSGSGAPQAAKPEAPAQPSAAKKSDHAAAYYHYAMAHMYEEMVTVYGRSEYLTKAIEEYRLALENDPSSEFLSSGLAELYARTGRIRDAVSEAQDIINRDPSNLEARKLLGRIYLRSIGDAQSGTQSQEVLKLATEQYESIVKLEPNSADNHLVLGRLYVISKDLLKAETEFKAAVQLEPTSEEAVSTLAYLYNEEGDSNRAVQVLTSIPEGARSAKLYSMLGFTYEQKKDYPNAIAAYKQATSLDHENLDAVRGLAQNLLNNNQNDEALKQYLILEKADPQDPQPSLQIAKIYQRTGKFDQALAPSGNYTTQERGNRALFMERLGNVYREENRPLLAVETFHKMTELGGEEGIRGHQEIIETYIEQKQWAEATKAAQEAVKKLPNDKTLKLTLATRLADDGKAEEGIQTAKALLKDSADDRETYISLANIYSRLKRWKDAEDAIAKADKLSVKPEEKQYIFFLQGAMYERQKKYDLAEQMFRQVLQQDPNNTMTLNYLGYMLADRNMRLEEALNLIKKALNLDPQNSNYLDSLGWAYFKLGNYDLAEENLRKAAEKTPNDATVQDHLGELYAKTGQLRMAATHWERALDEWNKSVAADVDQQDVARVQKKLESTKVRLAQQRQ